MTRILMAVLVGTALALAGCGRDPGPKGMPALKDQAPVRRARRALQGVARRSRATGRPGPQGPQGPQRPRGAPGAKGDPGPAGASIRSVQASGGPVSCDAGETLVSVFCPSGGAPDGAKCGSGPAIGLCLKKP